MIRQQHDLGASCLRALAVTAAVLAIHGCSPEFSSSKEGEVAVEPAPEPIDGSVTPISQLPFIDASTNAELLAELLDSPTALGETTALQVRLPPPHRTELTDSLVRVIGEPDDPHVLFRSDALVELGMLQSSPGPDFFTAFVTLDPGELDLLQRNQDEIASGVFGETTRESVLFSGRAPFARTIHPPISSVGFVPGGIVPVNRCAIRPVSTLKAWGQSLFITSPQVVLDPARTWDPCTGAGTKGGVWTFAHLMREMAMGSGKTPEDFVTDWLSLWLNNYTVNSDVVPSRTQMFNQVIQPWATASGVVATLVVDPITGKRSVNLTGPLDLDIAPFRLLAIVNRIDLGTTTGGGGGGYGNVTGTPETAGELRFIFGVVQPNPWGAGTEATCGRKLFTTIFEYGVPRTGCRAVVSWAQQWSSLQTFPGFTAGYLAQLQAMTESVVRHGAAPAKGNENAINQIRTNEIALAGQWELREFTLTKEDPLTNTDPPASGDLRPHTVALTPNESAISAAGADPAVNAVVLGPVTAGLELPVILPNRCNSSYPVDFFVNGAPFRGGNAFAGPPSGVDLWKANMAPATPEGICARHVFSLNTCHGCHRADSGTNGLGGSTNFVHVNPLSSIPVTLSKFLTGGGPGMTFNVADTQFGPPPGGPPLWPFADLDRRLQRLFDLSHCTSCIRIFRLRPTIVDRIQELGPVPADIVPIAQPAPTAQTAQTAQTAPADLTIGPITDLATVEKILELRLTEIIDDVVQEEPADFIRTRESASH